MTSRISFCNILKEDFRRRVWMLALSCLAAFITMPVAFLLENRNYPDHITELVLQENFVEFFCSYGAVLQAIVLCVGAIIVAVWGFRHLYSRKMVDLYHSIPAKRERLFLASYLNGLLIWFVPMLTATLITLLIALANLWTHGYETSLYKNLVLSLPVIEAAIKLILVSTAAFLSIYHFALICVMLSGNVVNALLQIAILGCGAGALYSIYTVLCSSFLDTYVDSILALDQILWASPMIGPFRLIGDYMETGAGFLFWDLADSKIQSPVFFRIISLLLSLSNFALAMHLYKKRPSELAEHGVDHKIARILLRFLTGIMASLFGGLIFMWLVGRDSFAWQIFGILFCGTLALGITEILMQMNFKAFFQRRIQMLFCLAISVLCLAAIFFDLTGFDNRLPQKENIRKASISISHYRDDSANFTFEGDAIAHIIRNHYNDYSDLNALYPLLEALTGPDRDNKSGVGTITVELETASGTFLRRYRLLESDKDLLRPIVESSEYQQAAYPASLGLLPLPIQLEMDSTLNRYHCSTVDQARIQEIMAAYAADFRAHNSMDQLNTGLIVGYLDLAYPYTYPGESTLQSYHFSLEIYKSYSNTLKAIQKYYPDLAYEKEDITVTSLEIYPSDVDVNAIWGLAPEDFGITNENPWVSPITITDPAEIETILAQTVTGDTSYGMFSSLQQFRYLGAGRIDSGSMVSLYVPEEALPLTLTKTMKEALQK